MIILSINLQHIYYIYIMLISNIYATFKQATIGITLEFTVAIKITQ